MTGTLYVCGTPIGNSEDITLRQLKILKEADIIACEDTRRTIKLLNIYDIKTKLISYHEHNKNQKNDYLLGLLQDGKNIALVSDAGMPAISDPGADLIRLAAEQNIPVTSAPGPTAFVTALVLSGFDTSSFVFDGFLPRTAKKAREAAIRYQTEPRTIILYEAPHRLIKTLEILSEFTGSRQIALARELTKKFEELRRDACAGHIAYYRQNEPKGEFVIVIENMTEKSEKSDILQSNTNNIEADFNALTAKGMAKNEAMKKAAKKYGVSKRDVYNMLIKH